MPPTAAVKSAVQDAGLLLFEFGLGVNRERLVVGAGPVGDHVGDDPAVTARQRHLHDEDEV